MVRVTPLPSNDWLIEPKQGKILIENKDVTNFPVYLRTRHLWYRICSMV